MTYHTTRCDIFCTVIDNFGDIGVCWRLAQQLANEHQQQVCLWVDDLGSFLQICPAINTNLAQQSINHVTIKQWPTVFPNLPIGDIADIVIEAFACHLPDTYIALMAKKAKPPVWINLEYLSAEEWVIGCHGLSSPHPQYALQKHFFFPGFVAGTGGVLCEKNLLQQRDAFLADPQAQLQFWQNLNIPTPTTDELRIFLFGYQNAVDELIQTWAQSLTPISVCIPQGALAQQCQQAVNALVAPHSLQLFVMPFLEQSQLDYLLWACDINFVRGEDSFVRAQWAAKPFVWHIYQQQENAHITKLQAFLQHYQQGLNKQEQTALQQFWLAWNTGVNIAATWPDFLKIGGVLQQHNEQWLKNTQKIGDLSTNLMLYCQKYL